MTPTTDTIAAIATPPGIGGIAVIRISGPKSWEVALSLLPSPIPHPPSPWTVRHAYIYNNNNELVDEALICFFMSPHSYTGEDVVEISCHGGNISSKRILKLILSKDVRIARPGEFTERAFLNNKLDLAQAEAVVGLIHARSEAAARAALSQLAGKLSEHIQEMRSKILDLLALLELELDFSEEDVNFQSLESRKVDLLDLQTKIEHLLASFARGRIEREGLRVAIVGAPNAGKSTLLNRIVGDERAIVSPHPGTTRDVVEAHLELSGHEVIFQDTAGLRDTDHEIENIGIARTRTVLNRADMILLLIDSQSGDLPGGTMLAEIENKKPMIVFNKSDVSRTEYSVPVASHSGAFHISALTGHGVEGLLAALTQKFSNESESAGELIITEQRHHDALRRAHEAVTRAGNLFKEPTLMASDLRDAANALGEITGQTIGEEVLDRIFSKFCIGK
ncbi:MAG: tRNA uridine-5-carboxymethylaminomethyl(34) synthesis GTPase MnmE [Calditrichaeota bacterium]|nr:tRNA uridine-5-carboxymethylaminomethyl(34) synthesis GTPase MnmE [Calditrichota bacterium]MCB9369303.1 tRNA uridine-5-carboxymethylaminomethyl(34) synthesis GTPase MnmE [Calditrichota bacterium]